MQLVWVHSRPKYQGSCSKPIVFMLPFVTRVTRDWWRCPIQNLYIVCSSSHNKMCRKMRFSFCNLSSVRGQLLSDGQPPWPDNIFLLHSWDFLLNISYISRAEIAGLRSGLSGFRVPAGAGYFSLHHFQTGSGTHPDSYAMGTKGCFSGSKATGSWSWPLTSI
jgi:hypothetical protein